jgi:hypothetical protein
MRRRGTCARCWACGVGLGRVAILRGRDANETTGAGVGGTRGGWARMRVGVVGSVGRLVGWFDLWVQVVDQWIHHSR